MPITTQEYRITGDRDLKVTGEIIAQTDLMESELGPGEEWTGIDIWQLSGGDWFAVKSKDDQRVEGGRVSEGRRIPRPVVSEFSGYASEAEAVQAMMNQTMKFFGWSWAAKRLVKNLGWATVTEID